ncbi:MAG: hypothetical protein IKU29_03635 [Parabacteroides sp.]|nr:hypothetical protein [Parabacteroides sp.]
MKKMRFLFSLFLIAFLSIHSNKAFAQKEWGIFNSLSLGAGISTTGIDVELATPITPYFALRGGISAMPNITISTDVDVEYSEGGYDRTATIDIKGSTKRLSGDVLLSYYPFKKNGFFLTAGTYFGGSTLVKINGHSDDLQDIMKEAESAGVVIGDYTIPVDKNGNVSGGLKVANVRPYVGLGYGRIIPSKRLNFMFEMGVQFHKTPKVYTDYGDLGMALEEADDTFTDIIEKVTVYPVLKLRLNGRIF